MNDADDCLYCTRPPELFDAMAEVATFPDSVVYLHRDDRYPGRCVVAARRHARELYDLEDAERDGYLRDVARVAAAIRDTVSPDKINYAVYGDLFPHLHFHLVPKRRGGQDWGAPFVANPPRWSWLPEPEVVRLVESLRRHLGVV